MRGSSSASGSTTSVHRYRGCSSGSDLVVAESAANRKPSDCRRCRGPAAQARPVMRCQRSRSGRPRDLMIVPPARLLPQGWTPRPPDCRGRTRRRVTAPSGRPGSGRRGAESPDQQPDRQHHLVHADGKIQHNLGRRHVTGHAEQDQQPGEAPSAVPASPHPDSHRGISRAR